MPILPWAKRHMVPVAATCSVLLMGGALAPVAVAATTSTTYYACLSTGGTLSSVGTTPPACKPGATQISWNQTGPQGPAGANGSTVLNGTGAPAATSGVDGDFYIDTQANAIYGPKAKGAWPSTGTSLVGPQGAPGSQGPQGPAGAATPYEWNYSTTTGTAVTQSNIPGGVYVFPTRTSSNALACIVQVYLADPTGQENLAVWANGQWTVTPQRATSDEPLHLYTNCGGDILGAFAFTTSYIPFN